MVAVSGAEWMGVLVLLLTGSAGAAWLTGIAALRRVRIDAATQQRDANVAAREVAVSEVHAAMDIYSHSVARLNDEVRILARRVDECEERHRNHAKICPLKGGT